MTGCLVGRQTWESLFALFFLIWFFFYEKRPEILAYFTVLKCFAHFHFRSAFLPCVRDGHSGGDPPHLCPHWMEDSFVIVTSSQRQLRSSHTPAQASTSGRWPASINFYIALWTLALCLSWAWFKGDRKIISNGPQRTWLQSNHELWKEKMIPKKQEWSWFRGLALGFWLER